MNVLIINRTHHKTLLHTLHQKNLTFATLIITVCLLNANDING